MLTGNQNASDSLRGRAWVLCFLIATTVIAMILVTSMESNLGFGLFVRWMWMVMPYFNVQPEMSGLLAGVLTGLQWLLVGYWTSYKIRGAGPLRALGWTTASVLVAGVGMLQLLEVFGFRFVFEGP